MSIDGLFITAVIAFCLGAAFMMVAIWFAWGYSNNMTEKEWQKYGWIRGYKWEK
jgi:hypothetical protein